MKSWLLFLAVVGPLAIIAHLAEWSPLVTFAFSAASLIPLAAMMGDSTEELGEHLGPTLGGLINATLGNAPELIIAVFALTKGLEDVVKASITGSLLGNLLFGNGLAMIAGGWGRRQQKFDADNARLNTGLMFLAVIGLLVPAMLQHTTEGVTRDISLPVSIVLLIVYAFAMVHTIMPKPADKLNEPAAFAEPFVDHHQTPEQREGSIWRPIGALALVTLGIAIISEILTDAIGPAASTLELTTVFTGVFLLALAGNVAETFNAVQFARKDKMDLTLGTTVGASTQVALLVAPLLVLLSIALGHPMNLVFSKLELFAMLVAVTAITKLISDGKSQWIEGVLLLGFYVLIGIAFFVVNGDVAGL